MVPITTFNKILKEHKRAPWQGLYLWDWRFGPPGKLSLFDTERPRRHKMLDDAIKGYSESDWWNHSHLGAVPSDFMYAYNIEKRDGEVLRIGYKVILTKLLRGGSDRKSV